MPEVSVRRIRERDWRLLRDVRLRALEDAPDAFRSTLAREAAFPDETWQTWAREAASGTAETCLLAMRDADAVGVVAAFAEDGSDHIHLIAMWVAPDARLLGLGRALVDGVVSWAAQIGRPAIRLDVGEGNLGARRLYAAVGFQPTGRTTRYEARPELTTIELERLLQ